MNRTVNLAGVFIALLSLASCAGRPEMEKESDVVKHIAQMEREFAEATLRRDVTALERNLADNFLGVDVNGQHLSKAEVLARAKSPDIELTSLRHEDIRVRVFGDCAVATARTVVAGRYKGQETGGEFPYMRVWVKREGRWLAVATQSSAIPKR